MEQWEAVVEAFIAEWRSKENIVAALVCGSYVTGLPSARSDIDIHLLLGEKADWRERGNRYAGGYLIEYFVNPPRQIRRYFEEDYRDRRAMSMVQFLTGRVVFDTAGIVPVLKAEAAEWKRKLDERDAITDTEAELIKYGLWDTWDNLQDCHESGRPDFVLIYHNALHQLFRAYCAALGLEDIPVDHIFRYLSEPAYLTKYLKRPFPDLTFANLFIAALDAAGPEQQIGIYGRLTRRVWERTGGFSIDGWRLRSAVD